MTNGDIRKLGLAAVERALSCHYPNCDGGPQTGYCHVDCKRTDPLVDHRGILLDGDCDCLPVGERFTFAAAADRCKRYG